MDTLDLILDAALKLAAQRPWTTIGLAEIAREANLSLASLASVAAAKSDLIKAYARRIDRRLLASLEDDPVEGETHDRLFDLMLRRLELMGPDRAAIASIVEGSDWLSALALGCESQGWTLIAAGLASDGLKADLHKLGLAKIQADALRVWISDDDPGLARTMAQLDRALRDAASLMQRVERPLRMINALYQGLRAARKPAPAAARRPEDEPAYATAD